MSKLETGQTKHPLVVEGQNFLASLDPANPVRDDLADILQKLEQQLRLATLHEQTLVGRESGIRGSFFQFNSIIETMKSSVSLPQSVTDTFDKRHQYYKWYAFLDPNKRKGMDKYYKFLDRPFVDLWGSGPRNLNHASMDHIPGGEVEYTDFSAKAFMEIVAKTQETLGITLHPDYKINEQGIVRKKTYAHPEQDIQMSGSLVATFRYFPGIMADVTIASNLDADAYNDNSPELRLQFIQRAQSGADQFYIRDLSLQDVIGTISQQFPVDSHFDIIR
jgi:hypothetical protein